MQALWDDVLVRLHAREPAAGFDRLAFDVAERSRARDLLDALVQDDHTQGDTLAVPASLRAAQEALSVAADAHRRLVSRPHASPDAERALTQVRLARSRFYEEEARWLQERPLPWSGTPVAIDGFKALLTRGTALVSYFPGEDRSYVWTASSDTLRVQPLPGRGAIEREVARALTGIVSDDGRSALQAVTRLRSILAPRGVWPAAAARVLVIGSGPVDYRGPPAAGRASWLADVVFRLRAVVLRPGSRCRRVPRRGRCGPRAGYGLDVAGTGGDVAAAGDLGSRDELAGRRASSPDD